jgi:hypothetical protein
LSYRDEDIKADIYIYDLNVPDIPDGVSSELAKMTFKVAVMEIQHLSAKKVYKESCLYLTCRAKNFVKIRLTYNRIPMNELGDAPTEFISEITKIIESGKNNSEAK